MAHERAQRAGEFLNVPLSSCPPCGVLDRPGDASVDGRRIGMDLATGLVPGCIEIEQPGMLEQCFLLHGTSVPLLDQQVFDPLDRLAVSDRVSRSRSARFSASPRSSIPLMMSSSALLGIDLEEVDLVDLVLPDDVRHGCQLALVGLATKPVSGELARRIPRRIRPGSTRCSMFRTTA